MVQKLGDNCSICSNMQNPDLQVLFQATEFDNRNGSGNFKPFIIGIYLAKPERINKYKF